MVFESVDYSVDSVFGLSDELVVLFHCHLLVHVLGLVQDLLQSLLFLLFLGHVSTEFAQLLQLGVITVVDPLDSVRLCGSNLSLLVKNV